MLRLWIVRHGVTRWNQQDRYQGSSDVPLNRRGRKQALQLAERLADQKIKAIYTSDLARAVQTAKIIAARVQLPVVRDPRLREINFGDWEGKTFAEIQYAQPKLLSQWLAEPESITSPRGEAFGDFLNRVRALFQELGARYPQGTMVLVTHAGPAGILICLALGKEPKDFWRFKVDPGSISEVLVGGRCGSLLRFNERDPVITLDTIRRPPLWGR